MIIAMLLVPFEVINYQGDSLLLSTVIESD